MDTDTTSVANEITNTGNSLGGTITTNADSTQVSGLPSGTYTVVAYDRDEPFAGCRTLTSYEVQSNPDIPSFDIDAIQARVEGDSICVGTPSGTITLEDTDVDGVLTDYNVLVTRVSDSNVEYNTTGTSPLILPGLLAGDYTVVATNSTTGCSSATGTVTIQNLIEDPIVTLQRMSPDQNCGSSAQVGELEVLVNDRYDHTNQSFLTFQWVNDATGNNVSTDFAGVADTEATLIGVPAGDYSITVTANLPTDTPPSTGCSSTRTYTITTETPVPSVSAFEVVDNEVCDDDTDGAPVQTGSFEVTEITYEGVASIPSSADYLLEVFTDEDLTAPATDGDGDNTNFIFTNLSAGTYFATIERTSSECTSDTLQFEINDNVLRPFINISILTADSTCSAGFSSDGTLYATASLSNGSGPFDDSDADYNFQWYTGAGLGSILTGETSSTITNLDAGIYTVTVERLSTGCVTIQEFELPNAPTSVEILTVDTQSSTTCFGDGIIEVTSVNRDNVGDYEFDLYDTDPTSGSATPIVTANVGGVFNSIVPGTYWLIGTNTIVGCETPIFEAVVEENFTFPAITLDEFDFQTNCDSSIPNGRLLTLADGQPENADYDFEWYYGMDTNNPLSSDDYVGGGQLSGQNSNEVSGLAEGFYTVEVTNNTTGCSITETYEMVDRIPDPVAISTSSSANTNCVNFNGAVAASVISPAPGRTVSDYSYYWFIGNLTTVGEDPDPADADFTGSLVEDLQNGNYVVLVVDGTDPTCQSEPTLVTVEDRRNEQMIDVFPVTTPVTVCFEEKNGSAEVTLPEGTNIAIQWLDEDDEVISTGTSQTFIGGLDIGNYTLVLTDLDTECVTERSFDIIDASDPPDAPSITKITDRTNCSVANGQAIATVNGSTQNLLFEWFDLSDMELANPLFTGSEITALDSIGYIVRATDITTGCPSDISFIQIGYEITDPVFEVSVDNSLCLRTEDGSTNQFTGTAIVNFLEFNDPSLTSYDWIRLSTGEVISNGVRLIDVGPGDYGVRINAANGCDYYAEFSVEVDLNVYNGVSANGDGKNDFFLIDCLDLFLNNNVKIFNRAGQKVYEVDGYDNTATRFEGVSNVGGGGLALPAGTYFYLIDLGTGGDPIQGYLELVR